MADGDLIRCDCGYCVAEGMTQRQVAEVRRHARTAHGISFSIEEALAILSRRELALGPSESAGLVASEDTTEGREQR